MIPELRIELISDVHYDPQLRASTRGHSDHRRSYGK
jgi:hypothetical protein